MVVVAIVVVVVVVAVVMMVVLCRFNYFSFCGSPKLLKSEFR